ncbi:MAG: YHS domain-containing protein [Flavobacteriaceae bacterium]|jgi:YHS domain-containing protein
MKTFSTFLLFLISINLLSQEHVNLKKGYAAEGYDVVAYFSNEAIEGNKEFQAVYQGIKYKFSSQGNLSEFNKNSKMYVPQYGGFCAYAVAEKGEKVSVNPKAFQIIDDKLYLFYNAWGVNTLEKWNEEGADDLQIKADVNWNSIVKKGR